MSEETRRSTIEHNRKEQAKRDMWSRQEAITASIERCSRALERAGDISTPGGQQWYNLVETECRETLIPLLQEHTGVPLPRYRSTDSDWQWHRLHAYIQASSRGFSPEDPGSRQLLIDAFHALADVAESEELIADELRSRVDVVNFSLKIGEHLQDWSMDIGDPVRGVALETEALKTLYCGGTGDGKSTALETEAEDFYQRNFEDGSDYKLIDLVDIDKGENWFYDIPQQQGGLRRIREDMDLEPDFAADDDLETPALEIMLPMSPGLASDGQPYDPDSGEFTAVPFTIPASELSKRILIPCIMSRLSDDQEQTVRQAYDDVDRRKDDWSLRHLADEIRERDELSPKHKADAVGVLRSLQDLGFIRTHDSPYTIEWREMFQDTETITIFSQAKLGSELGKFLCIAYLIDRILDLRQDLFGIPDAVLLMRELWEITPQRGRLSPDERAAAVQEALANRMGKVMRKLRHFDLHLIADTQEPGDLHKQVREMFNRYVVFQSNRDTVDNIFSWTSNDRRTSFWSTLNQKKGQAGIVGKVEPAVQERDIEFLSPVAFAPPSHHHYDKEHDTNGWRTRAKHLSPVKECPDCGTDTVDGRNAATVECPECEMEIDDPSLGREETLRCPIDIDGVDWQDDIPDELDIRDRDKDSGPSVTMRPVAAFANRCLQTVETEEYVFKQDVREAFNGFLKDHDREPWDFSKQSKLVTFGERLQDHYPDDAYDMKQRTQDGTRQHAYVGLILTDDGWRYIDR